MTDSRNLPFRKYLWMSNCNDKYTKATERPESDYLQ